MERGKPPGAHLRCALVSRPRTNVGVKLKDSERVSTAKGHNFLAFTAFVCSTSAARRNTARLASRLRFLLRVAPESQGTVTFNVSRGSHQRAVHQRGTVPSRPFFATIVLSLALVGLAAKSFIPGIVGDFACRVAADSGSATTDDNDDDGKPSPDNDSTTCKFGDLTKAILVTVDLALPHLLMPVHALAVPDTTTEAVLPDHFLPNAEIGPPGGIALGATTGPRADSLPGTVGTVIRSGCSRRAPLPHAAVTLCAAGTYPNDVVTNYCDLGDVKNGKDTGRGTQS